MSDLRTLAQAVVDAYETWQGEARDHVGYDPRVIADCRARYYAACGSLGEALDEPDAGVSVHFARAFRAALNAERAQGYARAMGEVESAMDAASDEALAEYQARRSDYRDGFCDGLCEAYRIAQNTAKAARERATAAERD